MVNGMMLCMMVCYAATAGVIVWKAGFDKVKWLGLARTLFMGVVILLNYGYASSHADYLVRWIGVFLLSEIILWIVQFVGHLIPYAKLQEEKTVRESC